MLYVTAKRIEQVIPILERWGFPFRRDTGIIPDDDTTLFVCSGMQRFKDRFKQPDGGRLSTLQSCVRTNDLDLVGDGSHLTYFEMLGNFSFGNGDYRDSVLLWDEVVRSLSLPITSVHIHPDRFDHVGLWQRLGYQTVPDPSCEWTDGEIGGHCCELYCGELEIGNLVNTMELSTDVGFGWERMLQVMEQKDRVDQTSLFDQTLPPVVADHVRCCQSMNDNGIQPSNKGMGYVFRRLLRRILQQTDRHDFTFSEWLESERQKRQSALDKGRKLLRKHGDKSDQWWWETLGVLPEERKLL